MIDHVAAVAEESERFARAAAAVSELTDSSSAPVPSCPDWSVDDLVWHLTEVQHVWRSVVEDDVAGPAAVEPLTRPSSDGHVDRFVEVSAGLVSVLSGADPEAIRWTWYRPDQRVSWIRRRQANEALIHRVDAELALAAAGGPAVGPIDGALAADGVDEMLRIMLGVGPRSSSATWAPEGPNVRLVAEVGGGADRSWVVAPGRLTGTNARGREVDQDALEVAETDDGRPTTATVRAPAADLDRWLWRRGSLDQAVVDGDRALVDRLPNLG